MMRCELIKVSTFYVVTSNNDNLPIVVVDQGLGGRGVYFDCVGGAALPVGGED